MAADMNRCGTCACHTCFERECKNCIKCIAGEYKTPVCIWEGNKKEETSEEEA